jgi:hemolysin-activating ACP:hemolysin acyltransferase
MAEQNSTAPQQGAHTDENSKITSASVAFGDIVTVLMRTEPFRDLALKDLEWLVAPSVNTGQFALAHGDPRPSDQLSDADKADTNRPNIPVAAVLWAYVSDEVDARLRANVTEGVVRLAPDEWRSGKTPWIVAAGGTPEALKAILGHMAKSLFKDTHANIVIAGDDGVSVQKLHPKGIGEPAA